MIIFKTVRWKNFLSTGNEWNEIKLNENSTTLIYGSNGAGKCVKWNTEIEINISNPQVRQLFEDYLNGQRKKE